MRTVRNLLKEKGAQVWSASPKTPVFEALRLMAEKDIGALVVMEGEQIAGIFTEQEENLQRMERAARGESDLLI